MGRIINWTNNQFCSVPTLYWMCISGCGCSLVKTNVKAVGLLFFHSIIVDLKELIGFKAVINSIVSRYRTIWCLFLSTLLKRSSSAFVSPTGGILMNFGAPQEPSWSVVLRFSSRGRAGITGYWCCFWGVFFLAFSVLELRWNKNWHSYLEMNCVFNVSNEIKMIGVF